MNAGITLTVQTPANEDSIITVVTKHLWRSSHYIA